MYRNRKFLIETYCFTALHPVFGYMFKIIYKERSEHNARRRVLFIKDRIDARWCLHSIALHCINLTDGMKELAHRAAALKLSVEKAPSPTQGHAL